jgi:hypothetical protein
VRTSSLLIAAVTSRQCSRRFIAARQYGLDYVHHPEGRCSSPAVLLPARWRLRVRVQQVVKPQRSGKRRGGFCCVCPTPHSPPRPRAQPLHVPRLAFSRTYHQQLPLPAYCAPATVCESRGHIANAHTCASVFFGLCDAIPTHHHHSHVYPTAASFFWPRAAHINEAQNRTE